MPHDLENQDLDRWLHPSVKPIFRDESLWALDKPAGVLSHPHPPGHRAANTLLRAPYDCDRELYRLERAGQPQRQVHLVHRLDQDTSGLILCALRSEAAASLKEALYHREVSKEYRALLVGVPDRPSGRWEDRLSRGNEKGRVVVRIARGTPNAVTRYSVVETLAGGQLSLVSLWPETGRTHQLRIQAASRGWPIAGDERYGDFTANRFLAAEIGLKYMFLHASRVELRHPDRGHRLRLHAPFSRRLETPLGRSRELARQVPRHGRRG